MEENQKESFQEAAEEASNKPNHPKSVRHRKKNYYNAIRKQMEFYFGDANLSKDRFLRNLIENDPYVPLETFMTFNKMKKLAKSVADIGKAIKTSEQLEVSNDLSGVRRRTEIPEVHDSTDKTIYVEHLPKDADHDWVIRVFSRYGTVAYVSLPKYKLSGKIKEFGFVEFESSDAVEKAIKAFGSFGGVLGIEVTPPEQLTSITSYIKEQKIAESKDNEKNKENKDAEDDIDSNSSSSENIQPPAKKFKVSDVDTPTSELESVDIKVKKKNRKHRRRSKLMADFDRDGVPDVTQMKIATKKEWKRLRNKYLNLQREKMAELKKHLSGIRDTKTFRSNAPRLPIHRSTPSMNFYQDRNKGQDKEIEQAAASNDESAGDRDETKPPLDCRTPVENKPIHYESGLIVHIRLLEPCVDVKTLKSEMRQYEQVKYVDVKEGAAEAFIRCESASAAQVFLQQISCAEYTCEILSGSTEQQYWNKIMQDRANKIEKKVKVRSRRGRDKIKQKLPNHIRFDEDDEPTS